MSIEPNDPNRCQYVSSAGQCYHEAVSNGKCQQHGGKAADKLRSYMITTKILGDAPDRHFAADELKSLREEIAITRGMVEKRLNMVGNDAEFVAAMPAIQGAIVTIEKLVTSCHTMEVKLGKLIGKAALLALAHKMVEIIATNLAGLPQRNEIVDKVSDEIVNAILATENEDERM